MGILNDIAQGVMKRAIKPILTESIGDVIKAQKLEKKPSVFDVGPEYFFPYAGAYNMRKQGTEVSFEVLRKFSTLYDVARMCINFRKRQITNLEWSIVPKKEDEDAAAYQAKIDEITTFFNQPARGVDFKVFIDRFLEDILVLDAGVIWRDRLYNGTVDEMINVDGATIRIKVSPDGSLPEAPETAYQQILKGQIYAEFTTNDMIYRVMNARNDSPYGISPLESLIIGVDTALKSQMLNAATFSQGNLPEGFYSLPAEWTPEQIKSYQQWFDAMIGGNPQYQSRIKFMPGGSGTGFSPMIKKDDMKFMEMELWLAKKCCAMFDMVPSDIGIVENNTANTSETQANISSGKGLVPMSKFLKKLFDDIIRDDFGAPDLEFEWIGIQAVDKKFELEQDKTLLAMGAVTIDEIRNKYGYAPYNIEASTNPILISGATATFLDDIGKDVIDPMNPDDPNAQDDPKDNKDDKDNKDKQSGVLENQLTELEQWERKCVNYLKKGRKLPKFEPQHLDSAIFKLIDARLSVIKSHFEVKEAFRPYKEVLKSEIHISSSVEKHDTIKQIKAKKDAGKHAGKS